MEPEGSLLGSQELNHCTLSWARWMQSTSL